MPFRAQWLKIKPINLFTFVWIVMFRVAFENHGLPFIFGLDINTIHTVEMSRIPKSESYIGRRQSESSF